MIIWHIFCYLKFYCLADVRLLHSISTRSDIKRERLIKFKCDWYTFQRLCIVFMQTLFYVQMVLRHFKVLIYIRYSSFEMIVTVWAFRRCYVET